MCFYFGKNALSTLAFSAVFKVIAWQQEELCIFRAWFLLGAAHFFVGSVDMLSIFQKRKVQKIHEDTHSKVCRILSSCSIAQNVPFEAAAFMYAATGIAFVDQQQAADDISEATARFVVTKAGTQIQRQDIEWRLTMYGLAATNTVEPRAFWSTSDLSYYTTMPLTRAAVMYGDFLVYPDCVDHYKTCPWPVFSIFDNAAFERAFLSDVLPELAAFMEKTAAAVFR